MMMFSIITSTCSNIWMFNNNERTLSTAYHPCVSSVAARTIGASRTVEYTGFIPVTLIIVINRSRAWSKISIPNCGGSSIPQASTHQPCFSGVPPAVADSTPSSVASDLHSALPWMVTIHQPHVCSRRNYTSEFQFPLLF